ncbi:hypothetical protein B0H17DRAFT_1141662 [Mycena rosella]|uniref:Uncharacterized protein n=1 Tax=Mycena rosella TaxID=1033263 RepID=A0AAD7CZ24_MYCRO|nr:hypothetical protein B0H17DRAFT_1141662 [Mycena rosella]
MNPKTPPPFRKRAIQIHDSPLPPVTPAKSDILENVILPKGNKLIVRGAYIPDAVTHNPVALFKASVDKLSRVDPFLESALVTVIPFSDRFANSAVTYIVLHPSLTPLDPDTEPRCDLLEDWKTALQDENPTWEVTWAPAAEGWDRQMWTRYPALVPELTRKMGKEPSKDEIIKCLSDILKANHYPVERVFTLGTPINGAGAILIDP